MREARLFVLCLIAVTVAAHGLAVAQDTPAPAAETAVTAPEAPTVPEAPVANPFSGHKVTLYRDTWGVPHVYADTLAEAAFGLGYAQAEDRLEDIFKNIRIATGTMAEAFGPQFAERDFIMKLVKNAELCEEYWKTAPAEITAFGDNYVAGVNAYLADHPEKKPEFAFDLQGWHCLTVSRAMILNWPLERIMNELQNKGKNEPKFSSNMFALAPSRTADGSAVVMTDPHLLWEGIGIFTEARAHGGDRLQCGYYLVGTPFPALGHNEKLAWAATTGGPDTSDVYMVELNPENPMQYKYFGEWKDFEAKQITINIKGAEPVVKPALYTIYGPVLEPPDPAKGIAYTAASPYLDRVDIMKQTYAMSTARSCEEFFQALGMLQMMEQNYIFADVEGNIQYVRNGATPIRPKGDFDWSSPLPGGIEATRWQGIHPIEELIQIKNPAQGYLQNCNNNPESMLVGSPMTRDKYPDYIFNQGGYITPRAERMLAMLDADKEITREEAMEYTLDVYDILAVRWQKALKSAVDAVGKENMADAEFAKAVETILAWDGNFTKDSAAGPYIRFWRDKCAKGGFPYKDINESAQLSAENQAKLLTHLSEAIAEMKAKYGNLDVVWGDINLIGRSGKYFPTPGGEFASDFLLTETVMDVDTQWNEVEKGSGKYVAMAGTAATMVMFLTPNGVESFSMMHWGQSADPNSPHHVDQAEKLYSNRTFKPTWTKKEDLLKNLESEKTLIIP